MRTHTWRNVSGSITLEIDIDDDGNLIDLQTEVGCGNSDLEFLRSFVGDLKSSTEVTINFVSSGSYTPAQMWGGWDNMGHDAEGEDERTFESAELLIDGVAKDVTLPNGIGQKLFDLFQKQIENAELEFEQDDGE